MKKLLLLSAVLLGTVAASQAGISVRFGLPLPPLPGIVIGRPAPQIVVEQPRVYAPAPVIVQPPVVCAPPAVVYAPPAICAPPVVVVPRVVSPRYYAHLRHESEHWH